jgi:hypothetical protein
METGVQRLEAQNVHLFPAVGTVDTRSGFICIPLEPAGGAVYELETPAGIGGVGRFHSELEESERIRISPVQSDPPMLDQDQENRADVLMVTPVWPSQQWWPTILELSYRPARILKPSEDLLLDATGISHPLLVRGSLLLAAWTLSGDDMKTEAFRREWCNYSWPAIAKPHQLLTKVPGTFGSIGALRGVKIPCLLL